MKAVVVVSFGSSYPEAIQTLDKVEQHIYSKLTADDPADLYTAYSSNFIRKKLASQGIKKNSIEEILEELAAKNYKEVCVQPTNVIPGQEYDRLLSVCEKWTDKFDSLTVGKPLISDADSLQTVAKTLENIYSSKADEAILFMGHGTSHISNFIYPALQTAFETNGFSRGFIATVEGWPEISDAVRLIKEKGYKKIYLAPLLLIAGDHVLNDMIGDEADSWKNVLEREGFEVKYTTLGLASYEEILDLYVR